MKSRFAIVRLANRFKAAEQLYTKGFLSYPRTETDQFDKGIDLKKLVEKQFPDNSWGQYAREYCVLQALLFGTCTDASSIDSLMASSEHLDLAAITITLILLFIRFVGSRQRNYNPTRRKCTNLLPEDFWLAALKTRKARAQKLNFNTETRCSTPMD